MTFEEATRAAALAAAEAAKETMADYRAGLHQQEEAITGVLLGNIAGTLRALKTPGLKWSSSILTNRGKGSEERRYGADFLIHVSMDTPSDKYSKGVLVQAKRVEPQANMFKKDRDNLTEQCNKMLEVTPSAFVFDYARGSMRCGAATRIAGSTRYDLYELCGWTPYRFFLELFRCPVGDSKFESARVSEVPVPSVLKIKAEGTLSTEKEFFSRG